MAFRQYFVIIFVQGVCLLLQLLFVYSSPCMGDELEPRRWAHIPIDTNFIGAAYAFTKADIYFDPVLRIENAQLDMHTWAAKYIRSFALFGKTARFDLLQTYKKGHWEGLLDGVPTSVKRSGWSDTNVRFAINLYGSPPLRGKEYAAYRATKEFETIVGAGLSIDLPTGNYMADKLINLGTNRFTFWPQLGVVHNWGNWSLEATGLVALFTDNNDFFNGRKLEQDLLYIIHGHLTYIFYPGVWAGASAGYDYGGRTSVDGTSSNDRKQNLAWACSLGFPVNRYVGAKFSYIAIRTRELTGSDSDTFLVGLSAFW